MLNPSWFLGTISTILGIWFQLHCYVLLSWCCYIYWLWWFLYSVTVPVPGTSFLGRLFGTFTLTSTYWFHSDWIFTRLPELWVCSSRFLRLQSHLHLLWGNFNLNCFSVSVSGVTLPGVVYIRTSTAGLLWFCNLAVPGTSSRKVVITYLETVLLDCY